MHIAYEDRAVLAKEDRVDVERDLARKIETNRVCRGLP